MIINFSDHTTIPSDIIEYILNSRKDFTNTKGISPFDRYALSNSHDDVKIKRQHEELKCMLKDSKILAGHYSKVYNLKHLSEGLVTLTPEEHINRIFRIIEENETMEGISDIECNKFRRYMLNLGDYIGGPRENLLSFYYPCFGGKTWEHYIKAIGGEVIEFGKNSFRKYMS